MTKRVLFASATFSSFVAGVLVAGCVDNSDCTRTATCPVEGGGGSGVGAGSVGGSGNTGGATAGGGSGPLDLGAACTSPGECASALCVDGVCCDSNCNGTCEACDTGTCTAASPGTDPDAECGAGSCSSVQSCAVGTHIWSESYGGAGSEFLGSIGLDASGNLLMAGSFAGDANFGGNTLNGDLYGAFIAKYTAGAQHLWSKAFDTDVLKAAAACSDPVGNTFLAGEFKGIKSFGGGALDSGSSIYENIFLVKLDASGNHIWSKQFGTPNNFDDFRSVACDASGNVILTGNADASHDVGATLPLSAGDFIVKFGPSGNHIFSQQFGGGIWRVAAIGGDVLVTGNVTQGPHDLGGLSINDGRYVARLSSAGVGQWTVAGVGGLVASSGTGNVIVSGTSTIPIDLGGGEHPSGAYLATYDPNGNYLWSRGGWEANPDRLASDPEGNILFVGDFSDQIDFGTGSLTPLGTDAFLVKLDAADGATLWVQQFGTIDEETAWDVAASATNLFAFGSFTNSIDLGGGSLTNGAQTGIWLAAFEP